MKNKSKKIMIILAIVIGLIIAGIVIPIIVKGDSNSAQGTQVLTGKTFTSDVAGVAVQGAMTNYGDAVFQNPVDAEGEDYIANIDLDDGYYESVQINAKPIYDRGVAAGATTHTGTYTFAANDTGSTKDLGVNHSYRYVNATNVYNKGKADGAASQAIGIGSSAGMPTAGTVYATPKYKKNMSSSGNNFVITTAGTYLICIAGHGDSYRHQVYLNGTAILTGGYTYNGTNWTTKSLKVNDKIYASANHGSAAHVELFLALL